MSGGSLDYLCYKISDAIAVLKEDSRYPKTRLHKDFLKHLKLVSDALHDVEWVLDCDYGEGDEEKAIYKVLNNSRKYKNK